MRVISDRSLDQYELSVGPEYLGRQSEGTGGQKRVRCARMSGRNSEEPEGQKEIQNKVRKRFSRARIFRKRV